MLSVLRLDAYRDFFQKFLRPSESAFCLWCEKVNRTISNVIPLIDILFEGSSPSKWGTLTNEPLPSTAGQNPVVLPPIVNNNMTFAERTRAEIVRRAHPLYGDVTLRLLTEIMNGRLFTTVSTSYSKQFLSNFSFESNLFEKNCNLSLIQPSFELPERTKNVKISICKNTKSVCCQSIWGPEFTFLNMNLDESGILQFGQTMFLFSILVCWFF